MVPVERKAMLAWSLPRRSPFSQFSNCKGTHYFSNRALLRQKIYTSRKISSKCKKITDCSVSLSYSFCVVFESGKREILTHSTLHIRIASYLRFRQIAQGCDHTIAAARKHSTPRRSSISATDLKEKLTFPERILLTYCGDTLSIAATSLRVSPWSCIKSMMARATLRDRFNHEAFSARHCASASKVEVCPDWLASKNSTALDFIF